MSNGSSTEWYRRNLALVKDDPEKLKAFRDKHNAASREGNRRRRERMDSDPEYAAKVQAKWVENRNRYKAKKDATDPDYFRRKYAERKEADPQLCRRNNLKSKYDLTFEEFEAMYEAQHGECKICSRALSDTNFRKTHIDHNHLTGIVRGLLCPSCNLALGKFQDNPEILRRAAVYVEVDGRFPD